MEIMCTFSEVYLQYTILHTFSYVRLLCKYAFYFCLDPICELLCTSLWSQWSYCVSLYLRLFLCPPVLVFLIDLHWDIWLSYHTVTPKINLNLSIISLITVSGNLQRYGVMLLFISVSVCLYLRKICISHHNGTM